MDEQTSLTPVISQMTSLEPDFDVESMEHSYQEIIVNGVMEAESVKLESESVPETLTEETLATVEVPTEPESEMTFEMVLENVTDLEIEQAMALFDAADQEEIPNEVTAEANATQSAASTVVTTANDDNDVEIDVAEIARMVPDKMAFKIGEVAELTGLKPYVLRYWESEFDALTPQKSAFNQRMYSKRDVETVLLIKKLLYDEKFSIAGAKKKIKELRKELKVEKKRLETLDRFDQAVEMVEDLASEIASLRKLFQAPA